MSLPKVNRISVDIDITDPKNDLIKLITSYIHARIIFGKDNVYLFISPSGRGYRLYIKATVDVFENLLYRALFNDDPYRLLYSLKRYFLTQDPDEIDVEFIQKDYKIGGNIGKNRIREVDLESDEELKKIIEELEKKYGSREFEDLLLKNLHKFEKVLLPNMKPVKVLYIVIENDEKVRDEIINEVQELKGYYRVIPDVYYDNRIIIRIVATQDALKSILEKFRDKILKYKFMDSVTKY